MLQIEKISNGFVLTHYDDDGFDKKIVIENLNNDLSGCYTFDDIKANHKFLNIIINLLDLKIITTDKKYSILLQIKDDQGTLF